MLMKITQTKAEKCTACDGSGMRISGWPSHGSSKRREQPCRECDGSGVDLKGIPFVLFARRKRMEPGSE